MKASVISIGNSKGIRLPQVMLKECNIETQVELVREKDMIVIKPIRSKPRDGWGKAFSMMHERKEDALLLDEKIEPELEGWEWK
ncbi:MAG: AbrB/MazE/SpoVT family DNA-binding domain-containing protein [Nitrospirae bacterium]|nr:MAG: AbrB/MazE/SpoVT family DNA-binding domain-containing protein [Nitrospirota bacterium]